MQIFNKGFNSSWSLHPSETPMFNRRKCFLFVCSGWMWCFEIPERHGIQCFKNELIYATLSQHAIQNWQFVSRRLGRFFISSEYMFPFLFLLKWVFFPMDGYPLSKRRFHIFFITWFLYFESLPVLEIIFCNFDWIHVSFLFPMKQTCMWVIEFGIANISICMRILRISFHIVEIVWNASEKKFSFILGGFESLNTSVFKWWFRPIRCEHSNNKMKGAGKQIESRALLPFTNEHCFQGSFNKSEIYTNDIIVRLIVSSSIVSECNFFLSI